MQYGIMVIQYRIKVLPSESFIYTRNQGHLPKV